MPIREGGEVVDSKGFELIRDDVVKDEGCAIRSLGAQL